MRRVVLDQGCARSTTAILNQVADEGWDVVHVGELGMSQASDRDILDWARTNNRVVVTLDADFHAILAVGSETSPSTMRIRVEGLKAHDLARMLRHVWPRVESDLAKGAMVSIDIRSIRIRSLPVG